MTDDGSKRPPFSGTDRQGPAYAAVVLDADSTVSGIEGIDWLAARRGDDVARRIAALTDDAMRGAIALEDVYGARLDAVRPTRDDVEALASAYVAALAPGCAQAIARLQSAGVRVVLVSGGLRQALFPLARQVGIAVADVHAVDIRFDDRGDYAGFDSTSPLTTSDGKRDVVVAAGLASPVLAVGDGRTDLAMKPVVARFAAYVGFVRRESVVAEADVLVASFDDIVRQVLPN